MSTEWDRMTSARGMGVMTMSGCIDENSKDRMRTRRASVGHHRRRGDNDEQEAIRGARVCGARPNDEKTRCCAMLYGWRWAGAVLYSSVLGRMGWARQERM